MLNLLCSENFWKHLSTPQRAYMSIFLYKSSSSTLFPFPPLSVMIKTSCHSSHSVLRYITASSKSSHDFIQNQLSGLDGITWHMMMRDYSLCYKVKIVVGIYDDRLLVKPTTSAGTA